jgi:predicted lipase
VNNTNTWSCSTCDSGVVLKAVIDSSGARALVGYDSGYGALFVAYRGSENVQNWIDNVKFFKTAPYPDMPEVEVELGFYEWYTDLKTLVDSELESLKSTYKTSKVKITGHSAGGAVATLHAFDMARGEVSECV